jgi:hypothetical protein
VEALVETVANNLIGFMRSEATTVTQAASAKKEWRNDLQRHKYSVFFIRV